MSGGGDQQTTTVQNPAWLDSASQNLLGAAGNAYGGAGGPNGLQLGAYATAGQYGQMAPGALGQAYNTMSANANFQPDQSWLGPLAGLLGQGMGGSMGAGGGISMGGGGAGHVAVGPAAQATTSTIDPTQLQHIDPRSVLNYNIGDYTNPYTQSVIDANSSDIERARQVQGRNDAASAASAGAFGGSRQAVQSALTNSEYDRNQSAMSAQLRDQAYNAGMGLIQGDISNATNADQFNANQMYQTLLANAGFQNAGSQFNAGQTNAQTQAQIAAEAQLGAAGMQSSASEYATMMNARNNQLSTLINGALGYGQMGLGADLNAATLRGNSATGLQNFGQQGMSDMGGAGDALRSMPMDDLSWYGGILGGIPHGQSSSVPIYHNRGAGALGGAASGAATGSAFGPYGTAIGAGVGGLMGYFGS